MKALVYMNAPGLKPALQDHPAQLQVVHVTPEPGSVPCAEANRPNSRPTEARVSQA